MRHRIKQIVVGICVCLLLVCVTGRRTATHYESRLREDYIDLLTFSIERSQYALTEAIASGDSNLFEAVALQYASMAGNYQSIAPAITGAVDPDGGWGTLASAFANIGDGEDVKSLELDFAKRVHSLNDSLLTSLKEKESFTGDELATLLNFFEVDVVEIVNGTTN